jgi:hypothetical protein
MKMMLKMKRIRIMTASTIPMMVPTVKNVAAGEEEEEEDAVVLLGGATMITGVLEKMEPLIERGVSGPGSCWQAASRVMRTRPVVSWVFEKERVGGRTVCNVFLVSRCLETRHARRESCSLPGTLISSAVVVPRCRGRVEEVGRQGLL